METKQDVRSDARTALDLAIQRRIDEILFYIREGWTREQAIAYVERSSTLGPASWARILEAVNPPAPMAQPSNDPAPVQACMMLGTCDAVAALASKQQIPVALLDVLAGYALAGLDNNRQAAILADLGTGRIVSTGALTKRCTAALAAQAQDATFAWGQ